MRQTTKVFAAVHPQEGLAENARKAQDLRDKAQQLALDEMRIMNQAVGLNLLAKQVWTSKKCQQQPAHSTSNTFLAGVKTYVERKQGASREKHCPIHLAWPTTGIYHRTMQPCR
jgi:hypothetical protein